MSEAPEKELSKNQRKKMADLAEKVVKTGYGGDSAPAMAATVPKPAVTSQHEPSITSDGATSKASPTIAGLKAKDAASAKVVWASLVYGVTLQPVVGAEQHPVLTIGKETVSCCGNAMALTISLWSKTAKMSLTEQLLQDEWCEWERTVLRKAVGNDKMWAAALEHLNTGLGATSGIHMTGSHLVSVADIALLSTLYKNFPDGGSSGGLPAHLQRYMQAHTAQWIKVEAALEEMIAAAAAAPSAGSVAAADLPAMDLKQPSLLKLVDGIFRAVLKQLFGSSLELPDLIVTKCSNPKHGDYQCSAAMPAFAALKKAGTLPPEIKSPPQVAKALIDTIGENHPALTELGIQGSGFVVCRLRSSILQDYVNAFLESGKLPLPTNITPQTCVVDFSSPNIAKEMHVGHLRSTIIGESVCRILELVGHRVYRVNHVGDWGTQFGMLIQYLKEEYPHVANTDTGELPNITDLTQFYKSAKQCFDANEEFKEKSRLNVVALQSGDPDCMRIWRLLCDVSRKEFEKVYKRLDVTVEECGESFYNDKIPIVIDEFAKAGLLKEEEGGAKVVFTGGVKVPLMLQKSDGGYGYDSTDMAALKYRLHELKADRIIYITDFSQGDHFKLVFSAGHDIGWVDHGQRLQHIGFGTVQGEDGKRFKTRSGDTVRLVDLLDEAADRMEASLKERIASGSAHITQEEVHEVAEAIGYGSVKYFDLRRNPTSNYKFSYDMMLATNGDTGVYLLYARARLESILTKAHAEHGVDLNNLGVVTIAHPSERNLALALQQFPDILDLTLDDLYPYHICKYVYDLSIASAEFHQQCRVLGSAEMRSRLLLCQATIMAMKQCFDLLGIRQVKSI